MTSLIAICLFSSKGKRGVMMAGGVVKAAPPIQLHGVKKAAETGGAGSSWQMRHALPQTKRAAQQQGTLR
jgi:hypothetical protein